MQMNTLLRLLALFAAAMLVLGACGGDSDSASTSDDGDAAETNSSETADDADPEDATTTTETAADPSDDDSTATDENPPSDDPEDGTENGDGAGDDAATGAGGAEIGVSLIEWALEAPIELPAGPTTFAVSNDSSLGIPHKLGIARGDTYDNLPQLANGAIDEDALGDDFLGDTENLAPGEAVNFDIDLEAGDYVLFCNIAAGPSSHAAQGQVLSVSVS